MRRMNAALLLTPLAGAAVWAGSLWAGGSRPATLAKPADGPPPTPLPVARVVLFASGVGHVSRQGTVDGDARVDLQFPETDVNDLLKSLTVEDLDGGKLGAVSYDSPEPVDRILSSFAIDLSGQPPLAQILQQARGEAVEVALPAPAPAVSGTVVGVEERAEPGRPDQPPTVAQHLTVLTAGGLQAVNLRDVQRVKFQNPALEAELRKALEVLARSHDSRKKSVSVRLGGQGKRRVRVGYVVEAPVWKTSYRLLLDKSNKPTLQGWAVVENTTDEDWTDVRMALVAGRPVSFRMDLYNPLFAPRPVVEPEQFAGLRPPEYQGPLGERQRAEVMAGGGGALGAGGFQGGGFQGGGVGLQGGPPTRSLVTRGSTRHTAPPAPPAGMGGLADAARGTGDVLRAPFPAVATGEKLGSAFQYVIDQPVSVARQKSALLPIVSQPVEVTRVSIFSPTVYPTHPLLGVRLTNTTPLNLAQGPVTVFDGPAYAGDARLPDLQPKESRLLGYALDLGVEVATRDGGKPPAVTKVAAGRGLLVVTRSLTEERVYTLVNRSADDRTVLVAHPNRAGQGYKLVAPAKPTEETADLLRFAVPVKAGATVELTVAEEKPELETATLTQLSDPAIAGFLRLDRLSPALREKLQEAAKLRAAWSAAQREYAATAAELQRIAQDQDRIRRNLAQTPKEAEVYQTYLAKLTAQEKAIDGLTAKATQQQAAEAAARGAFERFASAVADGEVGTGVAPNSP